MPEIVVCNQTTSSTARRENVVGNQLAGALDDLAAAIAFKDKVIAAARAGEETASTGAERDAREWIDSASRAVVAAYGVLVLGEAQQKPPCAVCCKPYAEHGSYPTCATHPYTANSRCAAVGTVSPGGPFVGDSCPGAECKSGCARAAGVAPTHGGKHG